MKEKRKDFTGIRFTDSDTVAAYYMEDLQHCEREFVIGVYLGADGEWLGDSVLSVGTESRAMVSPRELFTQALRRQATNVYLLHNHPSGRAQPSEEDREFTRRLELCACLLGIRLLDHLIIGDGSYYSFRKEERE